MATAEASETSPVDLSLWCRQCKGSLSDPYVLAEHLRTCASRQARGDMAHLFFGQRTVLPFPDRATRAETAQQPHPAKETNTPIRLLARRG